MVVGPLTGFIVSGKLVAVGSCCLWLIGGQALDYRSVIMELLRIPAASEPIAAERRW